MPNIIEREVEAWAWCRVFDEDELPLPCEGSGQVRVKAIERTIEYRYTDNDPHGVPGIENSTTQIVFRNEKDLACPVCGASREISLQERPRYEVRHGGQEEVLAERRRLRRERDLAAAREAREIDLAERMKRLEAAAGNGKEINGKEIAEMRAKLDALEGEREVEARTASPRKTAAA